MRHEKPDKPLPLLVLESTKSKLNKRAIKLDVNRSWLTRLFIDYGFRTLTDSDIEECAKLDKDSVSSNRGIKR